MLLAALCFLERSGTLVQYGHGLLGKDRTGRGYLHQLADDHSLVLFAAVDGHEAKTTGVTLNIIEDASRFKTVSDRLHQGWMEFLTLSLLVQQAHFLIDPNLPTAKRHQPRQTLFLRKLTGRCFGRRIFVMRRFDESS